MFEPAMAFLLNLGIPPETGLIALVLVGNIVLGTLVGAVPGAGGINAVVILLPFMFTPSPLVPFAPLCVYWGARFGELLAAALLRRSFPPLLGGKQAVAFAVTFLALTASVAFLAIVPAVSALERLLLSFGPATFAVCYLAIFCSYIAFGSRTPIKAAGMVAFGLVLAMVGLDIVTGTLRLTFGWPHLISGIPLIAVMVGLYVLGQVLVAVETASVGAGRRFWLLASPVIVLAAAAAMYPDGAFRDLMILLVSGVLGYGFKRLDYPVAGLLLGLLLGDNFEHSMRQALVLSDGEVWIFASDRLSVGLLILSLGFLSVPLLRRLRHDGARAHAAGS